MQTTTDRDTLLADADTLPPDLRTLVEGFIAEIGSSVTSPSAMRGQCQVLSDQLVRVLSGVTTMVDEDGDEWEVTSQTVQLFDAPAAVADDDMAHGHYVVRADWGLCGSYFIDLSAAQFAGRLPDCAGPLVRTYHGW